MKYDDKYPNAEPGIPPEPNVVRALREDQARPCKVCGNKTRWFHRAFIVHVCSEGCTQTLDRMN